MNSNLARLALRRDALVAQAAAQRLQLGEQVHPLRAPVAIAERIYSGVRFLGDHPIYVVAIVATVVALKPALSKQLLTRGFSILQLMGGLPR